MAAEHVVLLRSVRRPRSNIQYSTVQYSTVQYSTVQYSIVQYSTEHGSTVQYRYGGHGPNVGTG